MTRLRKIEKIVRFEWEFIKVERSLVLCLAFSFHFVAIARLRWRRGGKAVRGLANVGSRELLGAQSSPDRFQIERRHDGFERSNSKGNICKVNVVEATW